jgi:hypothetical protein
MTPSHLLLNRYEKGARVRLNLIYFLERAYTEQGSDQLPGQARDTPEKKIPQLYI